MKRMTKERFFLIGLLLATSGCTPYTSTNTASDPIEKNGHAVGTMNLTFTSVGTQNTVDHKNTIEATASTGETFEGNVMQQSNPLSPLQKILYAPFEEESMMGMSALFFETSKPAPYVDYNTKWHGELVGNKGTIYSCDFDTHNIYKSPIDGGEGTCIGSNGTSIPVNLVNRPVHMGGGPGDSKS